MAREKTGVKLEIWAYTDTKDGKKTEFGYVMAPWVKDTGGVPYGDALEGMQVIARELRKAHREAAALRAKSKASGASKD